MFSSVHDSANRLLDELPLVHDVPVADSHHEMAPPHERKIASSIGDEGFFVSLPTIGLEHDAVSQDQVDPTNANEGNLRPYPDAESPQSVSTQCLEPRFTGRIDIVEHPCEARREARDDAGEIGNGHPALMERRVDDAEGVLVFAAEQDLSDELRDALDRGRARRPVARLPVLHAAARVAVGSARVSGACDVKARVVLECPQAEVPRGGDTGETAAERHGANKVGRGIRSM